MSFQVFLVKLDGPPAVLNITATTTIASLRSMVQEKTGITTSEQRLVCNAKELQDKDGNGKDNTVKDYDIHIDSTIFLILRLRGGVEGARGKFVCFSCLCHCAELKFCCPESHGVCNTCFPDFFESVIKNAIIHGIVPTCPQCRNLYPSEKISAITTGLPIEKRLEIEKKTIYYSISYKFLHRDEIRVACPTPGCEYIEIHTKTTGIDYLFCRICKAKICVYCRIVATEDHSKCKIYGYIRMAFEDAITEANIRRCPKCNGSGTKDEKCTHITCGVCKMEYCYVCLKSKTEISSFSAHRNHSDFKTNLTHCPYLLSDVDNYKGNEADAVIKFHKDLILCYIQKIIAKFGSQAEIAYKEYNIQANSGYTLEEVKTKKLKLIPQIKLINLL